MVRKTLTLEHPCPPALSDCDATLLCIEGNAPQVSGYLKSTDSGNILTVGSDGLLMVPPTGQPSYTVVTGGTLTLPTDKNAYFSNLPIGTQTLTLPNGNFVSQEVTISTSGNLLNQTRISGNMFVGTSELDDDANYVLHGGESVSFFWTGSKWLVSSSHQVRYESRLVVKASVKTGAVLGAGLASVPFTVDTSVGDIDVHGLFNNTTYQFTPRANCTYTYRFSLVGGNPPGIITSWRPNSAVNLAVWPTQTTNFVFKHTGTPENSFAGLTVTNGSAAPHTFTGLPFDRRFWQFLVYETILTTKGVF